MKLRMKREALEKFNRVPTGCLLKRQARILARSPCSEHNIGAVEAGNHSLEWS